MEHLQALHFLKILLSGFQGWAPLSLFFQNFLLPASLGSGFRLHFLPPLSPATLPDGSWADRWAGRHLPVAVRSPSLLFPHHLSPPMPATSVQFLFSLLQIKLITARLHAPTMGGGQATSLSTIYRGGLGRAPVRSINHGVMIMESTQRFYTPWHLLPFALLQTV